MISQVSTQIMNPRFGDATSRSTLPFADPRVTSSVANLVASLELQLTCQALLLMHNPQTTILDDFS